MNNNLNSAQISCVRTLWELAQARIDNLYSKQEAENEKQACEEWFKRVFPNQADELIRSESQKYAAV